MKDLEIFEFFESPAQIKGKRVMIGTDEAAKIKKKVITRGFTTKNGKLRSELSWLEFLVLMIRDASTAAPFDHEFWGAWTFMPEWARRLSSMLSGGWLDFPKKASDLTAKKLGDEMGFFLTVGERKLVLTLNDPVFREQWESSDLKKALRGIETEFRDKVRVKYPGYEDLRAVADEGAASITLLRSSIFQFVGQQKLEECGEFLKGFVAGWGRGKRVDLEDEFSNFNLRMDIAGIISDHWDSVAKLATRAQIAEYVREHLPDFKKAHFAEEGAWSSFCGGALRDIFRDFDITPAKKGRPRKMGKGS